MSDFLPPKKAPATSAPSAHKTSHEDGGSDEISVQGLSGQLADAQKVTVRKNSGADVGTRSRLNLVEGSGISLTVADDGTEVDVTIAGSVTQYTDEMAQDAVGAMVDSSLTYVDGTPLLQRAALTGAVVASAGSNATALGSFTKAQLDSALSDGNGVYVDDAIVLPAGTTSLTPLTFQAGTLNTTPVDGGLEMDATNLYGCTDAGNRGYIPIKHFIRAASPRNLPNDTNLNALFNSPANGRLTLETGVYLFTALIVVTSMSGTSGNAQIDVLGAGSATVTNWAWLPDGHDSLTAPAAHSGTVVTSNASGVNIVTASTQTSMAVQLTGTFEVTGAGTIIPSIKLVNAAAAVLAAGSYFTFERIGAAGAVSCGQWD